MKCVAGKIMSFDVEHINRKDHRKPYFGSKQFDTSCRNHGSCDYCKGNRTHKNAKRKEATNWKLYYS